MTAMVAPVSTLRREVDVLRRGEPPLRLKIEKGGLMDG